MENQLEIETKILKILTNKYKKDGGNNGVEFTALDHILNLSIQDRNEFLFQMAKEKKFLTYPFAK
ncbi:hypothetical protein ACR784_24575 [Sphingobacterium multivorum]|uniref:Uncharacterized protein n=1 Tax=Sphingobacterium thalpophilum TaxID=259 RepID=A0ACD5C6K3_9SPHI